LHLLQILQNLVQNIIKNFQLQFVLFDLTKFYFIDLILRKKKKKKRRRKEKEERRKERKKERKKEINTSFKPKSKTFGCGDI